MIRHAFQNLILPPPQRLGSQEASRARLPCGETQTVALTVATWAQPCERMCANGATVDHRPERDKVPRARSGLADTPQHA